MFFPKAMTEIELVVPSKDLLAVTKILSRHGVFHQADSNYPGVNSGSASTWQETAAAYAAQERRIQVIMAALSVDEGPPLSADFDTMIELEQIRATVDGIETDSRQLTDQFDAEKKQLEALANNLRQLEPVAEVEVDIRALRKSSYLYSVLGMLPTSNVERLRTSLARVPHEFLVLRSDSQKSVVWLAGSRGNADVFERATRSAYLDPLVLPEEYEGNPDTVIESIKKSIAGTEKRIEDLQASLKKLGGRHQSQLRELLWETHTSRILSEAIVRIGQLKHTYVIVGWVPQDDLEALAQRLKAASREILIEARAIKRTSHDLNIPVVLSKSKLLRPFQMLVTTYARPRYGELDPTILMAITFPLLFGAMFGDLGQGLVLLVLGMLMDRKIIFKGMSSLGLLIAYCGASAAVFGLLYGSVFGFEGEHFTHAFGFEFHPLWLSPLHDTLTVLGVAIDAGIVILLVAYLLAIFNQARSREWAHLCFGHTGLISLGMYFSFLGLLGGAVNALKLPIVPHIALAIAGLPLPFPILLIVFGVGVMFSEVLVNWMEGHRPVIEAHGIGGYIMYLIQAMMNLVEALISQLSNTLSYVRVGAFAIAHGGVSLAIFTLAGEEMNVPFWIVVVLGNIFIIGFEGLIVGIQTMRLHYYEFLGKFFTGGGMRFEPLRLTPSREEE
jgi:V/A-type H+-transporting ATPase subunit I